MLLGKVNVGATKRKPQIPLGVYSSIVKKVEDPADYKKGSVKKITYELVNEDGEVFEFSELFYLRKTERTLFMVKYLENEVEIDRWEDFENCQEKVTVQKVPSRYGSLPSIVEREFLGFAEEGVDNEL